MITVAIIGILSAIAYPSYREYTARSKRAEAQAILLEASQYMERFFAENYRYDQNTAAVAITDSSLFPSRYSKSPRSGTGTNYTITLPSATLASNSYVVKATRSGTMATDKCGNFGINNLGTKVIDSYSSSYASDAEALAACWK
jgi:type IV pilus assembly protein PilE